MKIFFIALIAAAAVIGASQMVPALKSKLPALPKVSVPGSQKLAAISLPKVTLGGEASKPDPTEAPKGEVQGIQTQEKLQETFNSVKDTAGKFASAVMTTPTSEKDTIDVSKVVSNIAASVEKIPGKVADQAKIEYCKQVLTEATKSATPTP